MAGSSDESGDILMRFVGPNGALPGESQTRLFEPGRSRTLMDGFTQNFTFEVDSFTFSMNVQDQNADGTPKKKKKKKKDDKEGSSEAHETSFKSWRTGGNQKYPVSIQPVQIKRGMDTTSSLLLESCINCTTFDKVSLIKLKPAGGSASGEVYLRIDFTGVLITDVSWSNDEPVQTTCKFISRKVLLQYRPQLPDGSLGAPLSAFWSMDPRDMAGQS